MDKLSGYFSGKYNLESSTNNENLHLYKVNYYESMKSIENNEYVEFTLRECSRDIFSKNIGNEEKFINISCSEKYKLLEKECNRVIEDFNIIEMIEDNIDDLLLYGEFIFKINKDFSITDDIKQKLLSPLYVNSKIDSVWDIESGYIYDEKDFIVLQLFKTNRKTRIKDDSGQKFVTRLSKGIIPESLINKIKSLKILEDLQPIVEVQSINEKQYFYLRFPQEFDNREAQKRVKKYELFLKRLLEMDGDINNIDSIIENMTKIKVIPLFGDQSQIEQNTITKVNRIDQSQIDTMKETISNLINMNINKNNDDNKTYLRFISDVRYEIKKKIQKYMESYILSLKEEIKDEKGKLIKLKDIYTEDDLKEINLQVIIPDIKGIDEIDNMDFISFYSESMKNVKDLVSDISGNIKELYENSNDIIEVDKMVDYYNSKIEKILGGRLFKKMEIKEKLDDIDSTESDEFS